MELAAPKGWMNNKILGKPRRNGDVDTTKYWEDCFNIISVFKKTEFNHYDFLPCPHILSEAAKLIYLTMYNNQEICQAKTSFAGFSVLQYCTRQTAQQKPDMTASENICVNLYRLTCVSYQERLLSLRKLA